MTPTSTSPPPDPPPDQPSPDQPSPDQPSPAPGDAERADLVEALRQHRALFRHTLRDLDDAAAAATPTASSLCLGGLVKHLTDTEAQWCSFIADGPAPSSTDWSEVDWNDPPEEILARERSFRMLEGETLSGVLAAYDEQAARTDAVARETDLDHAWPLPAAPWFEPGATRSARRVLVHLVGETAQHAGHADIIRETIDGQRTMG